MLLLRLRLLGGNCRQRSYFFTVALLERRRHLLTENIDVLRDAFRTVRKERPFSIDAIVVLPEHLHCIWTLPEGDAVTIQERAAA